MSPAKRQCQSVTGAEHRKARERGRRRPASLVIRTDSDYRGKTPLKAHI